MGNTGIPEFKNSSIPEGAAGAADRAKGTRLLLTQIVACGVVLLGPVVDRTVELPLSIRGMCGLLLVFASGTFVAALVNLGASLTPHPVPRKSSTLVTTGLYAFARHPIYSALLLMAFGWTGMFGSIASLGGFAALAWTLNEKARFEERLLLARYGDAYSAYMKRVGRFAPRFGS